MKGKFKSGLKRQPENKTGGLCMSWCMFSLVACLNKSHTRKKFWMDRNATTLIFKSHPLDAVIR